MKDLQNQQVLDGEGKWQSLVEVVRRFQQYGVPQERIDRWLQGWELHNKIREE